MRFEPKTWNTVVPGAWNRAILTPQWIGRVVFGLEPNTPMPIEIPMNALAPWRVRHEGCAFIVDQNRIEIVAERHDTEVLDRTRAFAKKVIAELDRTPVKAAGVNFRFSSEDDVDPELLSLFECGFDQRLIDDDYELRERTSRRTLKFEDGVINVDFDLLQDQTQVEFNFHRSSTVHRELIDWLSLPIDQLDAKVKSILEMLPITI